jgi:flagellar basal-body rod protein FlgC
MFATMDISSSGMVAQRARLDTIAANMANAFTTGDANNRPSPYQRRVALLEPGDAAGQDPQLGVHVSKIVLDDSPPKLVYDPGHPHALTEGELAGYVQFPNVDLSTEMINAIEATRAYEANLSMFETSKRLLSETLRYLA